MVSLWIRSKFPEFAEAMEPQYDSFGLFRELNTMGKVHFDQPAARTKTIFDILRSLPFRVSRLQLKQALQSFHAELEQLFSSHPEPVGGYNLRGYALYGWYLLV